MKFTKILPAAIAGLCLAASAYAQIDTFGTTRSFVLTSPTAMTQAAPLLTNGPIDTHGFDGIANVDLATLTNGTGAPVLTAQLYTSPDQTNLTALANYALAVSSSITITNLMYGSTNLTCTQTALYPGTTTTPTAATAGWATPYLAPALFTNTGAATVSTKGFYRIGYNVGDAARYLYIVWNVGSGTVSNATVSALFTGRRPQ